VSRPDGMVRVRGRVRVRTGGPDDLTAMLGLFDDAVRWLADRGRAGQWGTVPFSRQPDMVRRLQGWADGGDLRVAEADDGTVVGTLVLGDAPAYAPPATEPELYLKAFLTDRARAGTGIGGALLDHARREALDRGIHLLRVDCWAGGDGALTRYYVRAGFTPTRAFDVAGWPAQLFEQRLTADLDGDP
jgi:GNAT superfamily N-acetyltransferase